MVYGVLIDFKKIMANSKVKFRGDGGFMGRHWYQMIEQDLGHPIRCPGTHFGCTFDGKTRFVVVLLFLFVLFLRHSQRN